MKRVINETVVADVPVEAAIAQATADPWSMFDGTDAAASDGLPPAIDLGRVQFLGHGVRCHLRWTPDPGRLRERWIRSTVALTPVDGKTAIEMTTRYLSEATLGHAYGAGVLTHRAIAHGARQIAEGIRRQLETRWSIRAQSAGEPDVGPA